jgi:uncharacterized protein YpmS
LIASGPSAVYPLYKAARSQGKLRLYIRPQTTTLSSTTITSTLPSLDELIEKYLEKKQKNKFDDWYEKRNNGHLTNSMSSFCFVSAFFVLFSKFDYI